MEYIYNISEISVSSVNPENSQQKILDDEASISELRLSMSVFFVRISPPEKICMLLSFPFEGR